MIEFLCIVALVLVIADWVQDYYYVDHDGNIEWRGMKK